MVGRSIHNRHLLSGQDYLKAVFSHLVFRHPYCCIICQNVQWQALLVELSHEVADRPEGGEVKVQILHFALAATSAGDKIEFLLRTARLSPVNGG